MDHESQASLLAQQQKLESVVESVDDVLQTNDGLITQIVDNYNALHKINTDPLSNGSAKAKVEREKYENENVQLLRKLDANIGQIVEAYKSLSADTKVP